MNQWSLFKRSWSIFWKYKTLWALGLLAALGGGSANINYSFNSNSQLSNLPVGGCQVLQQIFGSIDLNSIIAISAIVGLVLFVVGTFARAGLYRMINAIEENQPMSVGEGFSAAGEKFLPLLAVRIILILPTIILGIIAAGSFLSMFSGCINGTSESASLFSFGAFSALAGLGVVIALLALLLQAIGISAERAVVLDDLSIFGSIARGWKYIWSKFADYFTIGLIWFLLTIGVSLLFVCALAPFFIAGIAASLGNLRSGFSITTFTTTLIGPAAIIAVIIGLLIGTFTSVFEISVWTLAYRVWRTSDAPANPPQ